jgi:ribulose-5-phosphate 4-epimerase/fuculose-1-phosphate aldolase
MAQLDALIDELVTANRILAREGVCDSFGHVSVRHPDNPKHFLLSRARAPEQIESADIMEFALEGDPIDARDRKPYLERFIHGGIYEARPDVMSVVHNHSPSVIPFGVTGVNLKPLLHMCASIGHEVHTWDSQTKFGDTSLLISDMAMGRDFAQFLAQNRAGLMRGHGAVTVGKSIRQSVWTAVYLELNAKLQREAASMGTIKFLSSGEVDAIIARTGPYTFDRAWENWCKRAGREPQISGN